MGKRSENDLETQGRAGRMMDYPNPKYRSLSGGKGKEGRKGVGCRRHWDGSTRYSKRVKTSSLQEP